jgi:type I restriction enzyme S subunit
MFGEPITNPMGWKMDRLANHIQLIGGYAFESKEFVSNGIPLIRIGAINEGIFKSSGLVYLPDSFLNKYSKFIVYPGDILITLTGTVGKEDYGNIIILSTTFSRYFLNQRVAKIAIKHGVFKPEYLLYSFKNPTVKISLTKLSRGIRQANISNEDILSLLLPIPPIALQEKFAQIVHKFDRLRTQQREADRQAEHLFQTILHRAFRGELTSQNADDEPESVLLEEIRAQQAKAEAEAKTATQAMGEAADYVGTKAKQQDREPIQLKFPGFE